MEYRTEIIRIVNEDMKAELLESIEDGYTYLHCTYVTSKKYNSNWWVNVIAECSVLYNLDTEEKLPLIETVNMPCSPLKYYLNNFGDYIKFVLIFPKLPEHWKLFQFMEYSNSIGSLSSERLVKNNTGVYNTMVE